MQEEFSIFDAKFLSEIARMKEKNIAIEILKNLINERVKHYQHTNLIQAEKFSELLNRSLSNYLKGMLTNEEVIQELLSLANDISEAEKQGNVQAMCNLGTCYYRGSGVKQDYHEAVKWFEKASSRGG